MVCKIQMADEDPNDPNRDKNSCNQLSQIRHAIQGGSVGSEKVEWREGTGFGYAHRRWIRWVVGVW